MEKILAKSTFVLMQLSLFILPLLRFMCSQMGELSCIQLLWRAIIVKKMMEKKLRTFLMNI